MGKVIFVRHGTTDFNRQMGVPASEERLRGQKDVPLNEQGRKDALAQAKQLDHKVDALYSSDLSRAVDTAKPIEKESGVTNTPTRQLRPWDTGDLSGQAVKDVLPQMKALQKNEDRKAPGGESFRAYKERLLDFLKQVIDYARRSGKTVVLVAHTSCIQLARAWAAKGCPADLDYDRDVYDGFTNEVKPGDKITFETTPSCVKVQRS